MYRWIEAIIVRSCHADSAMLTDHRLSVVAVSDVRVAGCAAGVVGVDAIAVGRVGRQLGVRIAGDVCAHGRDAVRSSCRSSPCSARRRSRFRCRVVGPGQVDLALGDGRSDQVGGRGGKRRGLLRHRAGRVGIVRIAGRVVGPHAVAVAGGGGKPGVRIAGHIRADRGDLSKVAAALRRCSARS